MTVTVGIAVKMTATEELIRDSYEDDDGGDGRNHDCLQRLEKTVVDATETIHTA